jgi:hypothetical protein
MPVARPSARTGSSAARISWTSTARRALLRHQRTAARPGGARPRFALLQPQRRAKRRRCGCRRQRKAHLREHVGSFVEDIERSTANGDSPGAMADRHLHRRLALQPRRLRRESLPDRTAQVVHAHRRRQQERQPDAQHPVARRRLHRRATKRPSSPASPRGWT